MRVSLPRRSATATGVAEKRPQRTAHQRADCCSIGHRPRPDQTDQTRCKLERHRDRRFDNRRGPAEPRRLLEIAIGLTLRQREAARQHHGCVCHTHAAREQCMGRIETFHFLGFGRA